MKLPILFIIPALVILTNCGVPPSKATKDNVQAVPLKKFPAQSWRLSNNRFFLWPNDLSVPNLSRAQAIAKELEDLDSKASPFNQRRKVINDQLDTLKAQMKPSEITLANLEAAAKNEKKELAKLEEEIAEARAELEKETRKPEKDQKKEMLKHLELKVAKASGQIEQKKKHLTWIDGEAKRSSEEIAEVQKLIDPVNKELEEVEKQQEEISNTSTARIDEISKIVEWFLEQPSAVTFEFTDQGINASINGWNFGDDHGPRSFSTESIDGLKPTMGNVKYTELGGIFEFEVYIFNDDAQTKLVDKYAFKIERVKYENKEGRNFFAGDITRTRFLENGKKEIRKGYAKLSDQNN